MIRKSLALALSTTIVLGGCNSVTGNPPGNGSANTTPATPAPTPTTAQKAIQHVVVIFGENESFDHYFGTYPNVQTATGEVQLFTAAANTPIPNNYVSHPELLLSNPNAANAKNNVTINSVSYPAQPFRLGRAQAWTASQNHGYTAEQNAFDNGAMDLFPLSTGSGDNATQSSISGPSSPAYIGTKALNLGYYDGNTVTAFWNYAQHYSMSDNSFSSTFGPSTQGALNVTSGQTNGIVAANSKNLGGAAVPDGNGGQTLISDADPYGDDCSSTSTYVQMGGQNIGDVLNKAGVTWGWFEGGFDLGVTNANGTTGCKRSSVITASGSAQATAADYVPHHQPFQYYASTANPHHTRPSAVSAIGSTDAANHQYDTHDFIDALNAGVMPAVSYLKAPAYQDAHPSNSDPLDEQAFVVNMVNAIQKSKFWPNTVIILAYDDSDGWYDHVSNIVNGSNNTVTCADPLSTCQTSKIALVGADGKANASGRCGYGMRQPLIVISPWAKKNYIDHTVTDQASIVRFIEDNFAGSARITGSFDSIAGPLDNMFDFSNGDAAPNSGTVILDPSTGKVTSGS